MYTGTSIIMRVNELTWEKLAEFLAVYFIVIIFKDTKDNSLHLLSFVVNNCKVIVLLSVTLSEFFINQSLVVASAMSAALSLG